MKRILYLLIAGLTISSSSCKKFLDNSPTDFLSPKNFYRNEADVNAAVTSIYDVLGKSSSYGRYLFFEMDVADDSFIALSSWTQDVGLYNYDPSDIKLTAAWVTLYNGINRANMLIENIDKANMDEGKKRVALGEALFLRAYYHFILANNWGNVPLKLKATASASEVDFPNTPYQTVYRQVVTDMEMAAEMVNPISAYNYGSRVTKSVVWGILARVNLKMAGAPMRDVSRYNEVIKWAQKVKTAGHALNPDYKQVFINMCQGSYDTKEVIWEVEFGKKNGTQDEEGGLGSINGIGANASIGFSYGAKHTTEAYFNSFGPNDLRRDWNISPYYYGSNGDRTAYIPTQIYNRYDAKWRREYETATPKFNGSTSINFPLLRYSDVLLMLAEAENEVNGPTSIAIDAVNEVKRRAHGKNLTTLEMVQSVTVVNGGTTDYTSAPTVTFSGGGGTGAAATAFLTTTKRVARIYMTNNGTGYTTAPTITLTGGGGTGASATAVLSQIRNGNFDLTTTETASKESLGTAIKKERSLELGYEGLRRFDLIRWGQFYSAMKAVSNDITTTAPAEYKYAAKSAQNVSEKDTLFAIPAAELNLNKVIIQNKGW